MIEFVANDPNPPCDFSNEMVVILGMQLFDSGNIKECDFLILHSEKCQHLDLHNSGNYCFPNEQCMYISKLCRVRDSFKVQDRPIASNVTYKKRNYSFIFHTATLRNYHLSSAGIVSKNIQNLKELIK